PKYFPIGSSFPKNFRANASLTTAIFRDDAVSSSLMPRPRTIGFPTASKNPAVTRSMDAELSALGPGAGCPFTQTPLPQLLPLSGEYVHRATAETPEMLESES